MTEEQVTKLVADALKWAAGQASLPAITDIAKVGAEIMFNTADGQPWALKVEAL